MTGELEPTRVSGVTGDLHETPKVENVGEAFMGWAEQYWALEKVITKGMTNDDNNESCPYDYTRQVFVNKINELSK